MAKREAIDMSKEVGKPLAKLLKRTLDVFWILGWIVLLLLVVTAVVQTIHFQSITNTIALVALVGFVMVLLFIILQLRRILSTVVDDQPFVFANVARFRSIGYSTLVLGALLLVKDLYFKGWNTFVILNADDAGITTNVQVALPFLFGILALLLAEIFKLGYEIYEENRLTI